VKPNYTYFANVARVIDGDTIDVDLDYGDYLRQQRRLRLSHVDAYEKNTTKGREALAFVQSVLPVGVEIVVTTSKPDKYGRQLAVVQLPDGRDLATELLDRQLATPYAGGKRSVDC
jgi:micrococcal nuclease